MNDVSLSLFKLFLTTSKEIILISSGLISYFCKTFVSLEVSTIPA